jgi:voltage-gated potassium channel
MEFTLHFLQVYLADLLYASPVLIFLTLLIGAIGYAIGRIEGWSTFDALYHAFINATTVGYGDLRPTLKRSKTLAVLLAFVGLIFTGLLVAIALHSADYAYSQVYEARALLNR